MTIAGLPDQAHFRALLAEAYRQAWFVAPGAESIAVNFRGARPGAPLADAVLVFVVAELAGRVRQRLREKGMDLQSEIVRKSSEGQQALQRLRAEHGFAGMDLCPCRPGEAAAAEQLEWRARGGGEQPLLGRRLLEGDDVAVGELGVVFFKPSEARAPPRKVLLILLDALRNQTHEPSLPALSNKSAGWHICILG